MEKKRTLNQMPGFKHGFKIFDEIDSKKLSTVDDKLAIVLGALARLYQEIEDQDALWETRQKVWKVEEKLGELRQLNLGTNHESS